MTFSGMASGACPDDQVLGLLVERELGEGEAEGVRGHLDGCATCRAVVAVMARARLAEGTPTAAGTTSARAVREARGGAPRAIDRYRVERLVGAGGMGQVFAAWDVELDRAVALKVIRPELAAASPAFAERMRRESRLMAKVSHPGVIAVYDVGTAEGQPWIAMELVAGATLGAHLRARPRTWREVVAWFRRAGAGLAAAHAAGLVHRDFKPENVLLALEGERVVRVVVTDFGVATAAASPFDVSSPPFAPSEPRSGESKGAVAGARIDLTATGVAIGTPAYMAPEQLAGASVDARADVFAFAVALWEALFGARPFRGASVDDLKRAQAKGALPVARRDDEAGGHVPDDVPGWVAKALAPALAVDPAQRPTLDGLLRELDPARRTRRARVVGVAIGAAVLVGGGVALAAAMTGGGGDRVTGPDPCAGGDQAMAAIWDGARQDATRRALATGGLAPRDIEQITATMSERAGQWRTTYERACRAPEPSPSRPLQLACLDARRVEMAGWVESVLAGGARHAQSLVGALSIPDGCLMPSPASVYAQVPADDRLRARVIELRARLFDAEQQRMRGDFPGALASVAALRPAVDATGFLPLAAELEYLAGTAESIGGDSQASADILRRAVSLAERGHHDHITAVARLALAQDEALNGRDLDLAEQHVEFAQAAIDRLGGDRDLQLQLDSTRVIILELRGDYREAEAIITALLAAPGPLPPDTEIQLRQQLGDLYLEESKVLAAIEQHRAVIARLEAMGPGGEANLAILHARLSDDLVARGDADGAVAAAERARALAQKVVAPTHVDHWTSLQNLGSAYHLAGRTGDALAAARRYRRELVALTGEGSVYAGEGMRDEGRYLAASGQHQAGIALVEQACALLELSDMVEEDALARCDFDVAEALHEQGRTADALPILEEVSLTLVAALGERHPDVAVVAISLGEALTASGDAARARPLLERALEVLAASELDPGLAADAAVALARALPRADAARARVLVDEAIARYTGAAPLWREHLAAARAFRAKLR